MKNSLLSLGLILVLSGCSPTETTQITITEQQNAPFAVATSTAVRISETPSQAVTGEQSVSINTFAVAMYKLLAKEDGNIFFSPYSITSALGMAEAGARKATSDQMRDAMFITLQGEEYHAAMNALDLALTGHAKDTEGVTLNIVNSTWAQSGWKFRLAYLDLLGNYYGAGVNLLDFAKKPDPSRIIINTWVADQTNQRIKDLIPQGAITPVTYLVLTNAIYFLADWFIPFDTSLTKDENFTKLDNSVIKTPLMQLGESDKKIKVEYSRSTGVRSINIPYKGNRLRMVVLLPDSGNFKSFENNLTLQTLNAQISAMDSTNLPPVRLPKFKFTSGSVSLVDALQSLGMQDAFNDKADFSGIDGTKSLYISDILHKAFIAVDEKGTEAAAATAVIISRLGLPPPDPPQFIADRPFIYLIRDDVTGVILFMGRVLDPTMEQ